MTVAMPLCPWCETAQHVIEEPSSGIGQELHCTMDGTYFYPVPEHVPFIDPDRESGKPRIGRPPKERCCNGHVLTAENAYQSGNRLECRTCRRVSQIAHRKRTQAASGAANGRSRP